MTAIDKHAVPVGLISWGGPLFARNGGLAALAAQTLGEARKEFAE